MAANLILPDSHWCEPITQPGESVRRHATDQRPARPRQPPARSRVDRVADRPVPRGEQPEQVQPPRTRVEQERDPTTVVRSAKTIPTGSRRRDAARFRRHSATGSVGVWIKFGPFADMDEMDRR